MNNNAISIANYFIDKSNSDPNSKYPLTLLRLVKYVYIAYGFALALSASSMTFKNSSTVFAFYVLSSESQPQESMS